MAQPLLATNRVTFTFTVSGLNHVQRFYCERAAPLLGVEQLADRDGIVTRDAQSCFDSGWQGIARVLGVLTTTATAILEEYSAPLWNPVAAFTVSAAGDQAADTPASQLTVVVRDTAFKKIRMTTMEPGLGYAGHSNTGYGFNVSADQYIDSITGADTDTFGIYRWAKSRGDRFIMASGMIAGATLDFNDKLKRSRNLA